MTISKTKLRSTLGALLAFLIAYGPELVTWLGGMDHAPIWVKDIAKGLGIIVGLATSGKGVALLNFFLPDEPTNTASVIPHAPMQTGDAAGKVLPMQEPTPVTKPETPYAKG